LQPLFRHPALCLLAVFLLGAAAPEKPSQTDSGRTAATPTGEVQVYLVKVREDGPREGVGQGGIDAPPARVFRALMDVEHWSEFMPFMEKSSARRRKDGSIESFQRLELPFPAGRRSYRIRVRGRTETSPTVTVWRIEWASERGSGNVKEHRGSWTLTANGTGGTRATLRLFTNPGGFLPASAADRGTAETLPWIFHGLRQHVRRSRYDDKL
jgi:uncharacterized protein YndB with AHSA1/START domain